MRVVEMLTEKYLKKPRTVGTGSRRIRSAMTATSHIRTRLSTSAVRSRPKVFDKSLFDYSFKTTAD